MSESLFVSKLSSEERWYRGGMFDAASAVAATFSRQQSQRVMRRTASTSIGFQYVSLRMEHATGGPSEPDVVSSDTKAARAPSSIGGSFLSRAPRSAGSARARDAACRRSPAVSAARL